MPVCLSVCLQVPCFVFDSDGKKHDLNPLIKVSGGYLVDDGDDTIDFYINICRNLSEYLPCEHVDRPMDFIDSKFGNKAVATPKHRRYPSTYKESK